MSSRSLNTRAAGIFRDCAELLRQQKANPFRINAYLRAAQTLESMDDDVAELRRRRPDAVVVEVDAGHSVQGDQPVELAHLIETAITEGDPR